MKTPKNNFIDIRITMYCKNIDEQCTFISTDYNIHNWLNVLAETLVTDAYLFLTLLHICVSFKE